MTQDGFPPTDPPTGEAGASPRDLTGSVLAGRYRIVRRLGVGAMGEVYLGEHLRMGRRDAIKVLRSGMARDPEAIARFTRGARNVARIRHPNVCQIYDFGEAEDGVLFLAMEYVDGGSLGDLLKAEGPLPPPRAIRLLQQAAEALHAAHEQGIIHRDLKPDNLMLARTPDGDGQVKVVDFDIARGPADEEGASVTRHGFVVGTPEYMSPEQLTGDPLDRRSDVYSLALVFVRMLTGALPFDGTTAQDIMLQRLTVEPKPLRTLAAPGVAFPEAMERAVARALARRPDDRTPGSRELAREVTEALRSESPPLSPGAPAAHHRTPTGGAAPPPPWTPGSEVPATQVAVSPGAGRGPGRPGWILPAGGALGILVAAGLAWAVLGGGGGEEAAPPPSVETPTERIEPEGDRVEEAAPAGPERQGETAAAQPPPSTPPGTPSTPPPERAVEPPAGVVLAGSAADARDVLMRQFTLQDPTGGEPPAAVHRAVRDTTQAVWRLPGLSPPDSALAAHILGLSLIALGDSVQGVEWLDRAVRVEPLDRYIRVRDVHRRPPR